MGELFGAKWLKQFGDTDSPAFETWSQFLGDLTGAQIKNGFVNLLKDKPRYLPDAVEFREFCLDLGSHGLPLVRAAYEEACRAPSPKRAQRWSHPAVYQAGVATGWFELASRATDEIFPRYRYHYEMLCQRVLSGEDITVPVPDALPEKINAPLTREQKINQMLALRESVGV